MICGIGTWQAPLAVLFEQLRTSEAGLRSAEARRRLDEVGANEPSPTQHAGGAVQLLLLFANPVVVVLLVTCTATARVVLTGPASVFGDIAGRLAARTWTQ